MIRSKIKKVSPEDQFLIITNHNYFVRTAIVAVAKIVIAASVLAVVTKLLETIFASLLTSGATKGEDSATILFTLLTILVYIIYGGYLGFVIWSIIKTYRNSLLVENNILGGDVFISKTTAGNTAVPAKTGNNVRSEDEPASQDDDYGL